MPAGTWAFLHETVIYEYLMDRYREKNLRLKQVIYNGKPVMKDKFFKVAHLQEIKDTFFPDIKSITISKDSKGPRPAEVKFLTSTFDYHRKKSQKDRIMYEDFVNQNGFILVLQHDYLPRSILDNFPVDVYELELYDFISYGKENFMRLLNQQIKSHDFEKTWVMYQGKNFWYGNDFVSSAMESGRWCPTENLTARDLTVGDKVIFIRTKGCGKHVINNYWYGRHEVPERWKFDEIYIARVSYPIQSREEYCISKGIPINEPLWYDETDISKKDNRIYQRKGLRWNRVFEFKRISYLKSLNIDMQELYIMFPDFVSAVADAYADRGSRELTPELYTSVIEYIAGVENIRKTELTDFNQTRIIESPHPLPPDYH